MDVPEYRARWQKKEDEVFRVRFKTLDVENNRVVAVFSETTSQDTQEHWVEFKMWDYDMMVKLRREATEYYNKSQSYHVDQDKFNELKVKHLMTKWSFGEVDSHLRLQHTNGVLTDESLEQFKRLYPCIVIVILRCMNEVLEGTWYEDELEEEE